MPLYELSGNSGGQTLVLDQTAGILLRVWGTIWTSVADATAGVISASVTATAPNGYARQHDMEGSLVLFDTTTVGERSFNFTCNHGGGASDLEIVFALGGVAGTSEWSYAIRTEVNLGLP